MNEPHNQNAEVLPGMFDQRGKQQPWRIFCYRGEQRVMILYAQSRSDADQIATLWNGGANMATIAEFMKGKGLKI